MLLYKFRGPNQKVGSFELTQPLTHSLLLRGLPHSHMGKKRKGAVGEITLRSGYFDLQEFPSGPQITCVRESLLPES